jgi:hypothetical protein
VVFDVLFSSAAESAAVARIGIVADKTPASRVFRAFNLDCVICVPPGTVGVCFPLG